MANADQLHKEASDALQVWYESFLDATNCNNQEAADAKHTKRHDNINMLWEAIVHILERHCHERAQAYESRGAPLLL